jgi:emericellamide synthase (highly reducing iterative type I polyketide synthase)
MAIQRGSVNSFGYGGTNAHVILDAYSPRRDSATCDGIEGDATKDATDAIGLEGSAHKSSFNQRLFVLTHDNQNGLGRSASNLKQYVQQMQPNDSNVLADLSYTLSMRRSRFPNRVAVRASDQESLLEALNDFSTGSISPQRAIEHPKICFVFTGKNEPLRWSAY